jgi:hypothetical protein
MPGRAGRKPLKSNALQKGERALRMNGMLAPRAALVHFSTTMSQNNRAAVLLSLARPTGLRDWVREHDERWSFVVLYLGLAVGLSVFVSLFWLLVVGGLHFVLECGRQAHYRDGPLEVVGHALWEVKLDVGLVLLALTLVLYIDVVLGLLGIQSAARAAAVTRAGARIGSRAASWERTLRTFLDEMARIAYAAVLMRKGAPVADADADSTSAPGGTAASLAVSAEEAAPSPESGPAAPLMPGLGWRGEWGMADRIGLALVVTGITLMIAAPYITAHDWGTAAAALMEELRPFPS